MRSRPAFRLRKRCIAGCFTALMLLAAAAPPAGPAGLVLRTAGASDTLRVAAGRPVHLDLNLPGETWRTANIGHLAVRPAGQQHNLQPRDMARDGGPQWVFKKPGYAMIALAAGPRSMRGHSDSWRRTTRCTKVILTITAGRGKRRPAPRPTAELTDKIGHRIEIRPLVIPPLVKPGSDMPVRLYYEDSGVDRGRLTAIAPDGSTQTVTADGSGFAHFRLHAAGRWHLQFDHTPPPNDARTANAQQPTTYRAELVFEVP